MKQNFKVCMIISLFLCIFTLLSSEVYAQQWDTISLVKNKDTELTRITNNNYCQTDKITSNNNYNVNQDEIVPCLYTLTLTVQWPPDAYGNVNSIPGNLFVSLWDGITQVAQVQIINNIAKFEDVPGNINYDVKITSSVYPAYNSLDAALMFNMANATIQQTFYKMRALDVDWNGLHDGVDKVLLANTITNNLPNIVDPFELIDPINMPSAYYDSYQMNIWLNDNQEMMAYFVIRGYIRY